MSSSRGPAFCRRLYRARWRLHKSPLSVNITENPIHIHDLNATILHCLGVNHERLTYRFQGRDFRLTDVHGRVVRDILA